MNEDRRRLESLNPEPDGGRGFADTDAGRRTRARVAARLETATLGLEPAPPSRRRSAWLLAAPPWRWDWRWTALAVPPRL